MVRSRPLLFRSYCCSFTAPLGLEVPCRRRVAVDNRCGGSCDEKLGYPLQGTPFKAFYRVGF